MRQLFFANLSITFSFFLTITSNLQLSTLFQVSSADILVIDSIFSVLYPKLELRKLKLLFLVWLKLFLYPYLFSDYFDYSLLLKSFGLGSFFFPFFYFSRSSSIFLTNQAQSDRVFSSQISIQSEILSLSIFRSIYVEICSSLKREKLRSLLKDLRSAQGNNFSSAMTSLFFLPSLSLSILSARLKLVRKTINLRMFCLLQQMMVLIVVSKLQMCQYRTFLSRWSQNSKIKMDGIDEGIKFSTVKMFSSLNFITYSSSTIDTICLIQLESPLFRLLIFSSLSSSPDSSATFFLQIYLKILKNRFSEVQWKSLANQQTSSLHSAKEQQ